MKYRALYSINVKYPFSYLDEKLELFTSNHQPLASVFFKTKEEAPFAETETEITDEESQEVPWSDDEFIDQGSSEPDSEVIAEEDEESSFLANRRERSASTSQGELELDGGPKGKFEGESPNFHEGEDLDIPPFLRKKRR